MFRAKIKLFKDFKKADEIDILKYRKFRRVAFFSFLVLFLFFIAYVFTYLFIIGENMSSTIVNTNFLSGMFTVVGQLMLGLFITNRLKDIALCKYFISQYGIYSNLTEKEQSKLDIESDGFLNHRRTPNSSIVTINPK